MKKIIQLMGCVIVLVSFWACPPPEIITIDYTRVSAPEEGGIRFTKYTDDKDHVLGPIAKKIDNNLQWNAASCLSLSGDGKKIAYSARKNTDQDNIYIKEVSGGRATVQRTFRNRAIYPAFSADGKHIAFSDDPEGNDNIYLMKTDEGVAVQQITSSQLQEISPTFSPSGNAVYFSKAETLRLKDGTKELRYYIWSYNLQTSLLTQHSKGFAPDISSDESFMIVTRNNIETNRGEIWKIDIEKGQETLILSDPDKGFSSPDIAPDGKRIICVGSTNPTDTRPANLDIYLVNMDGGGLKQLTFHSGNDVSPKWSADGASIFFISQRGSEKGQWNVWQMLSQF